MGSRPRRWLRWLNAAFLIVGLAALAWMIHTLGVDSIGDGLSRLGWGFALSNLAYFGALAADAFTLRACAGEVGGTVPYGRFLHAGMAGHAINLATPSGRLGEITKCTVLANDMPTERAAAALVVQNFIMLVTNCAMIVTAPIVAVLALGIEGSVATLLLVSAGVFFVVGAGALVLMHRGIGTWPFAVLARVGVSDERISRWRDAWQRVEGHWRDAVADRPRMRVAWASGFASRLFTIAEFAIILAFLGSDHVLAVAALSMANSQVVMWMTAFVPLQVGTAEGGQYALYSAVGLVPAMGVVVELVRKARSVVFIAIGIALLGWANFRGMTEES
jgi:hypothetical protein